MMRRGLVMLMVAVQLLPGLTVAHAHEVDEHQDGPKPSARGFHLHFVPFGCSHHHHGHGHGHDHQHHGQEPDSDRDDGDQNKVPTREDEPAAPAPTSDSNAPAVSYAPAGCGLSAGAVLSRDTGSALGDFGHREAVNVFVAVECDPARPRRCAENDGGIVCAAPPRIALSLHLLI